MMQKLVLFLFLCIYLNAGTLKINDKISAFSLPNQFDKIQTVSSEASYIIITFEKDDANLVSDFLSSKDNDFLNKNHAIFINDISSTPPVILKMFSIPKMREYKYDILLIYKENYKKFIEQENKITIYILENGFIKDIKFISTKNELEEIFR